MCVIGNPPYSGESANKGEWIAGLMDAYKREPGGKDRLNERNPKWLNDDYVKFIRFSEYLIDKNGEGVLGFITNHGYLDNPTFRGMRWHLLKTFDKIYILDLHGNAKKKEVTPEGEPDKNVFDIQQGVAIIVAIKRKAGKGKKPLATVYHADLWGERERKYQDLDGLTLDPENWQAIIHNAPQYPFVRRDFALQKKYQKGFSVQEFMPVNSVGIVTARDGLTIDINKETLWKRVQDFVQLPTEEARAKYSLGKDVNDWQVGWAQADAGKHLNHDMITRIAYRPFDNRWTFYTGSSRGFICRPRFSVMKHMAHKNIAITCSRQVKGVNGFYHVLCHTGIAESSLISNKTSEISSCFPLYLYPDTSLADHEQRTVNYDPELYARIQDKAEHPEHGRPDELAVFDYIYGVLHDPGYRETYAEFLKSDFPRIPWPSSPDQFWSVAKKGTALRKLHLMEPAAIGPTPYPFQGEGAGVVEKPRYADGRVWINDTQHFADVPDVAWTFYIGGYPSQPKNG